MRSASLTALAALRPLARYLLFAALVAVAITVVFIAPDCLLPVDELPYWDKRR